MRSEPSGANGSSSNPSRAANGTSASTNQTNGLGSVVNGSINGKPASNGVSSPHPNGAPNLQPQRVLPTFYGHDREEVTRILIQGLHDLGYASSASALSRESGYDLETPYASAFRMAILHGEWEEAEALLSDTYAPEDAGGVGIHTEDDETRENKQLTARPFEGEKPSPHGLALSQEAQKTEMLFLIRQQKYLELLEKGDLGAGLMVLRQELQPLHQDERQLHALSSLMMCQSPEDLKYQANWDGALGESRRHLLSTLSRSISPDVMIPEHRLAELLNQIKEAQIVNCAYHNTWKWPSLYTDHLCDRDSLPTEITAELVRHQNEVWFVQFSNDGTRLATASKDTTVIIYDTTSFEVLHELSEHGAGVVNIAWSPDDKQLITCSQNVARTQDTPGSPSQAKLWDTSSGVCIRTIDFSDEDPVTTAAWSPDGATFVIGSLRVDRTLTVWSRDSNSDVPLHNFSKVCPRVVDCAIATVSPTSLHSAEESSDEASKSTIRPVRLVAACKDTKSIQVFDYVRREKLRQVAMDQDINCLNLSRDGQEMLVSLNGDEVWVMGVEECDMRRKFLGQKQKDFVIRSCFGGAREGFVVSGGEDSIISIWHRHSSRLLQQLPGHQNGAVNAVAWNPSRPDMFASAGDDFTVKIWTKSSSAARHRQSQSSTKSRAKPVDETEEQQQAPPNWAAPGAAEDATAGQGDEGQGVMAALMRR